MTSGGEAAERISECRITRDAHAIRMLMLRHFTEHICTLFDDVTRREYGAERHGADAFTWRIVRCADEATVTVRGVGRRSGDVLEAQACLLYTSPSPRDS